MTRYPETVWVVQGLGVLPGDRRATIRTKVAVTPGELAEAKHAISGDPTVVAVRVVTYHFVNSVETRTGT